MARTKQNPLPPPKALSPLPEGTAAVLRPGPEGIAYHIPLIPIAPHTTISLPRRSRWTSGLHWHESHTEYLCLVQGSIFVRLNDSVQILTVKEGEEAKVVKIDKYVRHDWGRAESYLFRRTFGRHRPEIEDGDVVVEEWTDPADGQKAMFFWNLNRVITGEVQPGHAPKALSRTGEVVKAVLRDWWIPLQLFIIFRALDNWPVFVDVARWEQDRSITARLSGIAGRYAEWAGTHFVLCIASIVGWIAGLDAVSENRTPEELWEAWRRQQDHRQRHVEKRN